MKKSTFLQQVDHAAVESAIARAEAVTSGEIRVLVQHQAAPDPVLAAQAAFARLGMEKTRERNAVLLFVSPDSQSFAIIGDEGVHAKCGESFWRELAATMQDHFRRSDYTAALIEGVERAGKLLAAHFPPRADDVDELPNQIVEE